MHIISCMQQLLCHIPSPPLQWGHLASLFHSPIPKKGSHTPSSPPTPLSYPLLLTHSSVIPLTPHPLLCHTPYSPPTPHTLLPTHSSYPTPHPLLCHTPYYSRDIIYFHPGLRSHQASSTPVNPNIILRSRL